MLTITAVHRQALLAETSKENITFPMYLWGI